MLVQILSFQLHPHKVYAILERYAVAIFVKSRSRPQVIAEATDLVNAQQLSTVSDKVLRRFGDTAALSPNEYTRSAQLDHFVSIALGNTGGALVIGADSATAAQLASKMFDKPTHQLQLRDWIDALSELSNIVAGQLEFQLGSERSLGIPMYMSADSRSQIWPAVKVETEVWSSFAGHAFYFAVLADHASPQVQSEDN